MSIEQRHAEWHCPICWLQWSSCITYIRFLWHIHICDSRDALSDAWFPWRELPIIEGKLPMKFNSNQITKSVLSRSLYYSYIKSRRPSYRRSSNHVREAADSRLARAISCIALKTCTFCDCLCRPSGSNIQDIHVAKTWFSILQLPPSVFHHKSRRKSTTFCCWKVVLIFVAMLVQHVVQELVIANDVLVKEFFRTSP